jgi:hypothetical protein
MKYSHSPLFYLGLILIVFSPFAGWGILVLLGSGIIFLLLDLVIRKLPMPLWATLVVQGLVVLNWLFWGIRAIGGLLRWIDASFF